MTKLHTVLAATAILAGAGALSGCAGVVIGAGATAGVAASQERGFSGAVDDTKIRAEINHLWFQHDLEMYRKVGLTISEGDVLLTGVVPSQQAHSDAVRLAKQAEGVRTVYDEIMVRPDGEGLIDQGRDLVIAQTMKGRLLFDGEIRNINYSVDVVDGVIYLMGVAQDNRELDRVIAHARDIANVRRVVSYVRLKNDPNRPQG